MQPETPQQIPQPAGQTPQPLDPMAASAFQSSAPHPVQITQNPTANVQLPREKKSFSGLIITVVLILGLLGSLGFGIWAFGSMQDYKNNSDKKSAGAVTKALAEQKTKLDADYVEKDKQPYDTYSSSASSGSIKMKYPRTWSAYISESDSGGNPVDAYVHPNFVPNVLDNGVSFALRLQVVNTPYAEAIKQFESATSQSMVKVEPFSFPQVPGQLGSKITGSIKEGSDSSQGTMILMPLRDKTIKLWTESSSAFGNDFNTAVLPNFSFVP